MDQCSRCTREGSESLAHQVAGTNCMWGDGPAGGVDAAPGPLRTAHIASLGNDGNVATRDNRAFEIANAELVGRNEIYSEGQARLAGSVNRPEDYAARGRGTLGRRNAGRN